MTQVEITQSAFTRDVEAGMTRKELKAKYNVSVAVINSAAERWNLKIAIKKSPKYVFVDDVTANIPVEEVSSQY